MTSVLVVDDSQFMRTVIGNVVADHGYRVMSASDGQEAIEMVHDHDPDVVTMDVEMPGMDGIEAVSRIMASKPTPILMLSAHTETGAEATLDALARGAVDFLPKPGGEVTRDLKSLGDRIVEKIDAVAGADLASITPATPATKATAGTPTAASAGAENDDSRSASSAGDRPAPEPDRAFVEHPTIVIGASTGGPKILEGVLRALPVTLDPKVLVVQHMPASFTNRLAARLDTLLPFSVTEASDGQRVGDGDVVVAKGDFHLEVASNVAGNLRVRLTEREREHGVRPAIDVTMRTAADVVSDPLVGVALTGMGKDGAAGIEAIKRAGGATIAQDEASSPVFGIPQQAIATGCVDRVCAADDVPGAICDAFAQEAPTHG
ncbi:chemotaxis-specific protein-glutamate methyltransferase CheB [Halorubellus sp. JP-L1]|uniref:chemotaxis-specific protein-glutamate methyltransferase CheB n=1 Tax=Halorubellus sp. JP-L1 TaxID=2715753 RepID=UPI00140DE377|nr:chemotaxis-specific protein-glutamate methyltransferase CheB [Halorubellus sp. JP-L1]NHN40100.1 chemotaxis-specific protein-glutamate methyltransferase CheB [Halorubellus sp. JP-L1]